jgi:hypothetical protein
VSLVVTYKVTDGQLTTVLCGLPWSTKRYPIFGDRMSPDMLLIVPHIPTLRCGMVQQSSHCSSLWASSLTCCSLQPFPAFGHPSICQRTDWATNLFVFCLWSISPDLLLMVRLLLTRGNCWPAREFMLIMLPILDRTEFKGTIS